MSQTTHVNFLAQLADLRSVPDVRRRIALLALTTVAVALPVVQIVLPATGQGRIFHLGHLTGLSWLPVTACVGALVAPILPVISRFVRWIDIAVGALALLLAWFAWSGFAEAFSVVERAAGSATLIDGTFAPVTGMRWGLPVALAALAIAVWRACLALVRPLHVAADA